MVLTGTDCVVQTIETQGAVTQPVTFGGDCAEAAAIAAANPGVVVQHVPDTATTDQATIDDAG